MLIFRRIDGEMSQLDESYCISLFPTTTKLIKNIQKFDM